MVGVSHVWRDVCEDVRATGWIYTRGWGVDLLGVATYRAARGSARIVAEPIPGATEAAVLDGFARQALPLLLQMQGLECLHASAILTDAGVVAMCGVSGTGKSTVAAGLARRGYRMWADDAVVVRTEPGSAPLSVPLPFSSRLDATACQLVRSLPWREPLMPAGDGCARPLIGIAVFERVPAGAPDLEALHPVPAFRAVIDHSLSPLTDLGQNRLLCETHLDLVAKVPVYRIRFSPSARRFGALVTLLVAAIEELQAPRGNFEAWGL